MRARVTYEKKSGWIFSEDTRTSFFIASVSKEQLTKINYLTRSDQKVSLKVPIIKTYLLFSSFFPTVQFSKTSSLKNKFIICLPVTFFKSSELAFRCYKDENWTKQEEITTCSVIWYTENHKILNSYKNTESSDFENLQTS